MIFEQLETLLDKDKEVLKSLLKSIFNNNSDMYMSDLYMLGAVKRNYGNINGIMTLIQAKNMNATRCLLRVHLDTVLRFQAFWYVDNIDQFLLKVFESVSVNKFKDKSGKNLTDSYLADLLSQNYPWVKSVYKNLCGYIHFSDAHIWDGIDPKSLRNNGKFTFQITDQDTKYPDWSWKEILECTHEINIIFQSYMESYLLSRNCNSKGPDK